MDGVAVKRTTKITGHVIDEKGRTIAGAKVVCSGMESLTLFDGTFKFEDLSPGLHIVEIRVEGYGRQQKRIDAEEGSVVSVGFQVEPETGNARIYGYVLDDKTREPITHGGSVHMFRPTSNRNASIDPDTGFYELINLSPGTYATWTSVLDYEEQKKTVTLEEGEEKRQDFLITKKEEEEVPWG